MIELQPLLAIGHWLSQGHKAAGFGRSPASSARDLSTFSDEMLPAHGLLLMTWTAQDFQEQAKLGELLLTQLVPQAGLVSDAHQLWVSSEALLMSLTRHGRSDWQAAMSVFLRQDQLADGSWPAAGEGRWSGALERTCWLIIADAVPPANWIRAR